MNVPLLLRALFLPAVLVAYVFTAHAQPAGPSGDLTPITGAPARCTAGRAGPFPCNGVNILAFLPIPDIGGPGTLNDLWAWEDPETGRRYAIVGRNDGTAFIDVTDPVSPLYLGLLPTHDGIGVERDVKVYADHAYVVAEVNEAHGMQVFDLTGLRTVTSPPVTFEATARYDGVFNARNVAVNEDTGFAYLVGVGAGGAICGGGFHMVDLSNPAAPTFAGCFADTNAGGGYTHDAQCIAYKGPDPDYQGREICVGLNATAMTIVDVTDKDAPRAIANAAAPNVGYIHQGWFTDDHRYFFQGDLVDESIFDLPTRTLIWDFGDLDTPVLLAEHFATTRTGDHTLHIHGSLVFQSNLRGGLRVLDITDVAAPVEVAYLDTTPSDLGGGAWSNYPFFEDGLILLSSINEGLFLVELASDPVAVEDPTNGLPIPSIGPWLEAPYPNPFQARTEVALMLQTSEPVRVEVFDALGRRAALLHAGPLAAGTHRFAFEAGRDLPAGVYVVRATGPGFSRHRAVVYVP